MPEMDANAFIRMASNITKLLDLKIARCFRLATTEANNVQCADSNCMLLLRRKDRKNVLEDPKISTADKFCKDCVDAI